ncbi:MAG: 30S ribosomal protein S16 [Chloroflexota bacterium]
MVKIRLRRTGAKHKPSYRLVVTESGSPRDSSAIETIGHYNPTTEPETVVVDKEKALLWLKRGAQPTDTARRLLTKTGVIEATAKTQEPNTAPGEKS